MEEIIKEEIAFLKNFMLIFNHDLDYNMTSKLEQRIEYLKTLTI